MRSCRLAQPAACVSHTANILHKEWICQVERGAAISVRAMHNCPRAPMLMMDRITEITLNGGEFGEGQIVG